MDETKKPPENEGSQPPVEGSGGSLDETKSLTETERSQPPVQGSGGSLDETKSLTHTEGLQPPVEGSSGSPDGDPSRSGVTRSSDAWVRAGSDGSILLTTTTSTARLPSRCRTLNASLTPRMSKRI